MLFADKTVDSRDKMLSLVLLKYVFCDGFCQSYEEETFLFPYFGCKRWQAACAAAQAPSDLLCFQELHTK